MSIDLSQFKQTFIEESLEGLDTMESGLLNLDVGEADLDVINTIFRAAHSIKGGSGTFGFDNIASFTHVLETLLDEMRAGEREVTAVATEALLASVDVLRGMINALQDDSDYDEDHVAQVHAQLEAILHGEEGTPSTSPAAETAEPESDTGDVESSEKSSGWLIKFAPHGDMLRTGNDPVLMFRELEELGELTSVVDPETIPDFDTLEPEDSYLKWELTLLTDATKDQVLEVFAWVEDECDIEISPLAGVAVEETAVAEEEPAPAPAPTEETPAPVAETKQPEAEKPAAKPAAKRAAANAESTSIRVATDKVDALINMVGELVITQSMLSQLGEEFDESKLENLRTGLSQLERNTRELQESVMRIRMLPISYSFNRFPRLVHDLTQKLGKKVDLKLSGEQTELDKTVMEKIGDPLVHLVRNALDHGIEGPEKRKEVGKPEVGTLHLNAYHKGGNIVIEINDDGAGINKGKVIEKAIANGIISSADDVDDNKVYDLLFQPGFSTAEVVSDISGRGVGMDVVKRNIKELGGSIDVTSKEGEGSTFTIRLPLTLAILDGQLVRVGEEVYIIPLISIVESLQITKGSINKVAGKSEVYRLRDEYISIIRLYDLFGAKPDSTDLEKGLLVVVEGDGQKIGLFVDDLLGQQQVVIKSLESNFKRIEGVSGATILGDGTVALIMDIGGLIKLSNDPNSDSGCRAKNSSSGKAA